MFDLQINGLTLPEIGLHCDFWQAPDDESITKFCSYLESESVTGFYATLITAPYEVIDRNLARISEYLSKHKAASNLMGVHVEGGYISREGIHPREYLRELNLSRVKTLIGKYPGLIKLWTLCPAVDHDGSVTKYLQSQSVRVSYGHSNISHAEAQKAFDNYGVDLVTHIPNAMILIRDPENPKRFDHRNPSAEYLEFLAMDQKQAERWAQGLELGLGFTALHREDVSVTVICGSTEDHDLHMHTDILKLIAARKPKDKLILVSDSVAYDEAELKAGQPLGLRGGRVSLKKHLENFKRLGLEL